MSPQACFQLHFGCLCFPTKTEHRPRIENIISVLMSSISVKHEFAFFLNHKLKEVNPPPPPFPCIPPFLFHLRCHSSVQEMRATPWASDWADRVTRPDRRCRSPDVGSLLLSLFSLGCSPTAAPWQLWPVTHCRYVLHLNQRWEFAWVPPTSQGGCMEENNRHTMEIYVNDMNVGFCWFSFIAFLTVCIPGFGFSVTSPISQIGHFQFCFSGGGRGAASVCHSVLCLLMGALKGVGCDDASGPVLVWVMANGFRRSQSPPLGGAIPSAVSPEEAETLKQRGGSGGTSLNDGLFFFPNIMRLMKMLAQHNTDVSVSQPLWRFRVFLLSLCSMLTPSPCVWMFSDSLNLLSFSVLSSSRPLSVPVTPKAPRSPSCLAVACPHTCFARLVPSDIRQLTSNGALPRVTCLYMQLLWMLLSLSSQIHVLSQQPEKSLLSQTFWVRCKARLNWP